ncbi:MAG TPA: hypothetical protein DEQ38_00890 [Elusimicrobia bacterium]|nr:MAG: hypothetical protein A2089_09925 [Elusimicrobia bacterium GWD2_63_28]HCC46667.1 hypothetical protein [Elusimicrobiota bacterium]
MRPAYKNFGARLAFLALLAGGLSPAGALTPGELEQYYCKDIKEPFYSAAGTSPAGNSLINARKGSLPAAFRMPKPAGTLRIFVAGESVAALLGGGPDSELTAALAAQYPGSAVEVINAGMGAYESRRISGIVEEILSYEPDLVVVLSGNNENGKEFCPGFSAELARRSRNLRSKLGSFSLPEEDSGIKASLAIHEGRLRSMARLARKKNIPLIFCTLPANLRDYAPDGDLPLEQAEFAAGLAALEKKQYAAALERFRAALAARPRGAFQLFYAGRALDGLGRPGEARAYYKDAAKYDRAGDRSSGDRNEMIRRAALEEGAVVADLERAFAGLAADGLPGGRELADGVHWYNRYNAFVSGVIAAAARGALPKGAAAAVKPAGPGAPRPEDFRAKLSYAAASVAPEKFCDTLPNERAMVLLESLCDSDCGRLEAALGSDKKLAAELYESAWNPGLKGAARRLRPALLQAAAEMFRRRGNFRAASRLANEALELESAVDGGLKLANACPSLNLLRGRLKHGAGDRAGAAAEFKRASVSPALLKIMAALNGPLGLGLALPSEPAVKDNETARPVAAKEAASKEISDAAVEALRAGDRPRARNLLLAAVEKSPENFEARMNLCFLAAAESDAALGEEHCGEAVYLSAFPGRHALLLGDSRPSALLLRGSFYLKVKNVAEACRDFREAGAAAPEGWPRLAEVRSALKENCGE